MLGRLRLEQTIALKAGLNANSLAAAQRECYND